MRQVAQLMQMLDSKGGLRRARAKNIYGYGKWGI